jgi:hypothetical protein
MNAEVVVERGADDVRCFVVLVWAVRRAVGTSFPF